MKNLNRNSWEGFSFLHIEKTAGITLHKILHQSVLGYISPSPRYAELKTSDLAKIQKLYPFHIKGFGSHRINLHNDYAKLYNNNLFSFTFLRDPVKRYMSQCNYQSNQLGINWTIDKLITYSYFDNFQAFKLCGKREYKYAKQVLTENLDFVGLVEQFDVSLLILKQYLDLQNINYVRSNLTDLKKVNFRFEDQSPEIKKRIIYNNQVDIDLYSFVKEELFPVHLEKFDSIKNDLKSFQSDNDKYVFKKTSMAKRKISNIYLKFFVQLLLQKKASDKINLERPNV